MAVRGNWARQCHVSLTRSLPIKVLEVPLGGGTSAAPERSGITIHFAFAAEPGEDVNANELQATDVVKRAMGAVSSFRPTPQIVGQAGPAIDTGTNIATGLQIFENTWNVLLQRMALFNTIVAGIAEVSGVQRLPPFSV